MVNELLFPLRRCRTCVFDTRHPSKARCVVVATTKKKLQTCNQRLQFQSFKIPYIVTIKTARHKI